MFLSSIKKIANISNSEKLFNNEFILIAKTNDGETITIKNTVIVHEIDKTIVSTKTDKKDGYYDHDGIIITIKA